MVEIHNYQNASSRAQKLTNWTTLNRKVLTKFGFAIPKEIIDDIIQPEFGTRETFFLKILILKPKLGLPKSEKN